MSVAPIIMSHPDRDALVGDLAASIDGPVQIIRDDDERGPWPTAREAWWAGVDTGASWVLLLQDDVRVADDLLNHCRRIATLGERCVCLHCFDSKRRREGTAEAPGRWIQVRFSTWGQAVLMPASWVREFLGWCARYVPADYKHDDTRVTWWLQEMGRSCWVPLPNLVQHRQVPSLLGHPSGETLAFEQDVSVQGWGEGIDSAPVVRGSPIDSRYEHTRLCR